MNRTLTDAFRDSVGILLNVFFILFVVTIVVTYAWVCYKGIFDIEGQPINSERFNQVWTSLSGIVGAIVGWLIRELTSGKSEEVSVLKERGKYQQEAIKTQQEIGTLSMALREKKEQNAILAREIDESKSALQKVNEEIKILGALKNNAPNGGE